MIDALIHLGLFLAEAIIIIAAILLIVAGILAIATKNKFKNKEKISIKNLNEHYENIQETINDKILSKSEKKETAKKQKALEKEKKKEKKSDKERIFVVNFIGDIKASGVSALREEITAILTVATPKDEVFVRLDSAGGIVHNYGLAASELQRVKNRSIPLIISVDKIAASGGYMMSCIADRILAAPFAVIGSIGVVAQLPNFHRLLKKYNIDFEQITAGEYKRTLSLFGENTDKGRKKVQEEVNEAQKLFKEFIIQHRPQVDIDKVATGEYWYATRAIDFKLVDELTTSDDYLLKASENKDVYEICYKKKKKLCDKFTDKVQSVFSSMDKNGI